LTSIKRKFDITIVDETGKTLQFHGDECSVDKETIASSFGGNVKEKLSCKAYQFEEGVE